MKITEALAEVKTIQKRITKKREFVVAYVAREENRRDPHDKIEGGTPAVIRRELQAIRDLQERLVSLRFSILESNLETEVTINGVTRSVFGWLTWRREVAPTEQAFLHNLFGRLNVLRTQAAQKGGAAVSAVASVGDTKPGDIVVNIDENELGGSIESLEEVLGVLDGQLSMVNATTEITL